MVRQSKIFRKNLARLKQNGGGEGFKGIQIPPSTTDLAAQPSYMPFFPSEPHYKYCCFLRLSDFFTELAWRTELIVSLKDIWYPQTLVSRMLHIPGADVAIDVNSVTTWEADVAIGGRNSCPSL